MNLQELFKYRNQFMFFEEESHRYFVRLDGVPWYKPSIDVALGLVSLGNAVECCSVTKLTKKFSEPFPAKEKAISCGEKQNRNPDDILMEWNYSGDFGSICHLYASTKADNIESEELLDDREPEYRHQIDLFFEKEFTDKTKFLSEVIVYDVDSRVAGTIDLIAYEDNWIGIFDYKTNSFFRFRSYNKEKMFPPFAYLEASHYITYSLQLHVYKQILRKEYDVISNREILIHLKADKYTRIECRDLSKEAMKVLNIAKSL